MPSRAQARGGLLGLLEHLLRTLEVLGLAAGDEGVGPAAWVRARNSGAPSRSSMSAAATKWPPACS
jgi:hypothetical protein